MGHVLIKARDVDPALWPPILFQNHEDWPWPFNKISRADTAKFGEPPRKIAGNAEEFPFPYFFNGVFWRPPRNDEERAQSTTLFHPLAIPGRDQWWIGDPYYHAWTLPNGLYGRNGERWDDVDGYYNSPSTSLKWYGRIAGRDILAAPREDLAGLEFSRRLLKPGGSR